MAKSKIRILLFPSPFFGGKGERVGCYPNCKGGIDNRIQREKLMKIGQVKLQLHAGPQFKESSVLLSAI